MSEPFVYPVQVRWGHCDPAGIVYFPRYFDMFHETMEAWFSEGLRLPYVDVIEGRKLGFPSVHTEADFKAPSAHGDALVVELRVPRVGRSSIDLAYHVRSAKHQGQTRATGLTTCVVMGLDPASPEFRRAQPIPEDLRTRIEAFRSRDTKGEADGS